MYYTMSDASYPMEFVSCGNLVSADGFVHPRRKIDSFVLIAVQEGTLYITEDGRRYAVDAGAFILLYPNLPHYGHTASKGPLSYYWVHFYVRDPNCARIPKSSLQKRTDILKTDAAHASPSHVENFLLPEYGRLSMGKRVQLLFVQLLDIAKAENYSATWRCHYALSMLLLEVTHESFRRDEFLPSDMPAKVLDIIEWIRTHYDRPIGVAAIAAHFHYHPTYISGLFRRYTGLSLLAYLNRTRIAVSKNLLVSRDISVRAIAALCGFSDEKYYMKLFKKTEDMTPTQYRHAFHQKKMNTR